jgi:hypothetical protein
LTYSYQEARQETGFGETSGRTIARITPAIVIRFFFTDPGNAWRPLVVVKGGKNFASVDLTEPAFTARLQSAARSE